ncbi:MAG TPA: winged helix-turn-helix domain-containing protein [Vicinamibacterales bacterium]|jgi:TolB-like protein/Flp pilus assembly protein TadD|nr:winged helix-turn-helix domain-containing protein [Vicinamibacterales bacterium]
MDPERLLRFESFELDTRSRELRKGKNRIRLQEQPFEILRLMLEHPGDVVTREELARKLWPDGTFVDFEHSLNAAVKRLRAALGDDADNPRFVETLPRRGYRFIASLGGTTVAMASAAPDYKARLAVMPFANLSGDSSQEYFSDGLTEEMFLQLGRLGRGRIGVISRSSSNLFKGSGRRAREIGEMLRADYLLEGSVRREADRVRITAQLVETSSESHLWTDVYERNLTDCLTVQAEVAARIAQSLAVELLPEQPVQASTDAAAYQTYLKGRYYWNLPGDQGFPQAIVYFRQASEADPGFAAAHADLARTYTGQAEYYNVTPREALETARPFAERSLQLDPHLSHAHLAVANIRAMLDWDWDAAEAGFRQAIALNPSSDGAHRWYGLLLAGLGKSSEAVREAQRARELDPLCLVVGTSAAWTQHVAGDYESAIDTCRNVMDMKPQFTPAWRVLGASLIQMGRAAEGVAELEAAAANAPTDPVLLAWLAHAKAARGECGVARTILDALDRLRAQRYVPAYHLALAHVGLGQHDEAFRLLDAACEERDPALINLAGDPRFDPVRRDVRFVALTRRLHL